MACLHVVLLSILCACCCSVRLGGCPHCQQVVCSLPAPSPDCSHKLLDNCGCCPYCARKEGETCGGWDNVGGDCAPGLRCSYRLGSILGEYKKGICETERCSLVKCGYRQRCVDDMGQKGPSCVCPNYQCANKMNLVCGNDDRTYSNVCLLQKEECHKNRFIGIMRFGRCPESCAECDRKESDQQMVCLYNGRSYQVGEKVPLGDPCQNGTCFKNGMVLAFTIPGCGYGPHEPDFGVDRPPVNGHWSLWSTWSECRGPPVTATRERTRYCVHQNEGTPCERDTEQQIQTCCEYGWSLLSPCSASCGGGVELWTHKLRNSRSPICVPELKNESRSCHMVNCRKNPPGRKFLCGLTDTWGYLYNEQGCRTVEKRVHKICHGFCSRKNGTKRCCYLTLKHRLKNLLSVCEHEKGKPEKYMDHFRAKRCRCVRLKGADAVNGTCDYSTAHVPYSEYWWRGDDEP